MKSGLYQGYFQVKLREIGCENGGLADIVDVVDVGIDNCRRSVLRYCDSQAFA